MDAAHAGMSVTAASDPAVCGTCHTDTTPASMGSLHSTLAGYDTALHARSAPENYSVLEEMESNHCNSCHTTCGDCHLSQPTSVGGGLLDGHVFVETPPMSQTCTACHGSRVKDEYYGAHEGIPSDVHFRARMSCVDCHTADEVHGVDVEADHRYDGEQGPTCESCHEDQIGVGSGIPQHEIHGTETLSCQGCHSTTYTNCTNCHVEQNDQQQPFYTVESHSLGFFLGQNPLRSAERPYEYVPVRHVPIDINSFSFYGDNLLPNFDSRPTWTYATPHNIQRITPQNESCTACHGNDSIFLTADQVVEAELAANAGVIVDHAPAVPEGLDSLLATLTGEPPAAEPPADSSGDFWGEPAAPAEPTASSGGDFWGEPAAPAEPTASSEGGFWGDAPIEPSENAPETGESFWGS
jgi:thiosulfate/3-mercaptopyruvate sulfurtransferase